ncbi:alkaline-phosphatase-like protein [Paraphoma chrysanthemicola]|uniref:Alkaline-phosphatase-like protein n=1 Tax=Paraphoma chrysanthemicola TaxID=798071 RepID=A0A8K0QZI3_9PLEO|nr:alkaline-phosphatase-like protein [Paraphoma chrysanthemicola]
MQLNLLAPFQAFLRPKSQFALFFVAFFIAKLLHLGSHFASLPIVLYLLYFPTFLLPDVLLLVGSKLLVYRHNGGQASTIRKCIGGVLATFTLGCSASQISFFVETGGEIQWMAASRVLGGSGGLGLLLSGMGSMIVALLILIAISVLIAPWFYDLTDRVFEAVGGSFRKSFFMVIRKRAATEDYELLLSSEDERTESSDGSGRSEKPAPTPASAVTAVTISILTVLGAIVVGVLQYVRPTSPPYAHMSGSLPITLIEAVLFQPINSEFCLPHPVEVVPFPFESFKRFFNHQQPADWLPEWQTCGRDNGPGPPPWLEHPGHDSPEGGSNAPWGHDRPPPHIPHDRPLHPPPGPPPEPMDRNFHHRPFRHGGPSGESPCEPMKLSNLNADLVDNLASEIKERRPMIKNILLLTLESTRKDMFPFKKGSHAYDTVHSSYTSTSNKQELDAKLRKLTPVSTFLSGESNGFESETEHYEENDWRNAFKDGMGAININGAITQAAYTLKSLVSSHCGVEPLAVDFTEETNGHIYQPCLPQIFWKMSEAVRGKHHGDHDFKEKHEKRDSRDWTWESAMIQSVTDQFDSQDVLNDQMGFRNVIAETTISNPQSKHYPPKQPRVNYFGFPETETLDYLRDMFVDAQEHEKRLFVSHLTSSPHHPFKTPADWSDKTNYLQPQRWRPEDPLDGYLNTIRYQDQWISQIFQMLHDVGALNETLVIMTGDHGLAFNSLDNSQSAVNNGHISNFAIPLLLVHPHLPRIQLDASTTPLSIIPTVLDLLLETDSLPLPAAEVAKEILPKYMGNSLVRKLDYSVSTSNGTAPAFFQPFHFSAINPGGSLLAISDASTTYRLIFPLCSTIPLRFTDIATDPHEMNPITAWTPGELSEIVKVRHGVKAMEWAQLAEELGRWWVWKQRAKWGYWGNARETSRGGAEVGGGIGRIKKEHWWETK